MPFEDPRSMAAAGLRPKGIGPSVIETVLGSTNDFVKSYLDGQEKRQKREKDKVDLYSSLRKAGYSREQAYDKTLKDLGFDKPEGGIDTLETQKASSEIEKNKALTAKYTAEADAKKNPVSKPAKPVSVSEQMKADLREKYIRGETLKPEETKLLFGYNPKGENSEEDLVLPGAGASGSTRTIKASYEPPQWIKNIIGTWKTPGMQAVEKAAGTTKAPSAGVDQEAMIKANMDRYGKSREEVVTALKKAGRI